MPELRQLLARGRVAQLGLVAQSEQRFAAPGTLACAGDFENLLGRQIAALPLRGACANVQ